VVALNKTNITKNWLLAHLVEWTMQRNLSAAMTMMTMDDM
jgi:hypothetical protein